MSGRTRPTHKPASWPSPPRMRACAAQHVGAAAPAGRPDSPGCAASRSIHPSDGERADAPPARPGQGFERMPTGRTCSYVALVQLQADLAQTLLALVHIDLGVQACLPAGGDQRQQVSRAPSGALLPGLLLQPPARAQILAHHHLGAEGVACLLKIQLRAASCCPTRFDLSPFTTEQVQVVLPPTSRCRFPTNQPEAADRGSAQGSAETHRWASQPHPRLEPWRRQRRIRPRAMQGLNRGQSGLLRGGRHRAGHRPADASPA